MPDIVNVPFVERLYCSKNDAVLHTGMSLSWIDKRIAEDRLATRKVGKRRLIVVESLLGLIEAAAKPDAAKVLAELGLL